MTPCTIPYGEAVELDRIDHGPDFPMEVMAECVSNFFTEQYRPVQVGTPSLSLLSLFSPSCVCVCPYTLCVDERRKGLMGLYLW